MKKAIAGIVVVAALAAVAWLVLAPRGKPVDQDIVIAVAGPMTGQYAAFGEQMKRGAERAVNDANAIENCCDACCVSEPCASAALSVET